MLSNVSRTTWDIRNVPTLVLYERVDDEVKEAIRLIECEILDQGKLTTFIGK